MTNDLDNIFGEAEGDGIITSSVKDMMSVNFDNDILNGACDIDEIDSTEVILVTFLMDDSGSMYPMVTEAIAGQNEMIKAFVDSKQSESILVGQWAMNRDKPYHSYVPAAQATIFDSNNYDPGSMTPLYDKWFEALTANVAYAQQLRAAGTPVRSIAIVLTDGEDNDSHTFRASECKKLAEDLLNSEQFVLAFIGVGSEANFKNIAEKMGFPSGAVMLAKATPSDLRKVFRLLSQSVIRASQTAVNHNAVQNNFFT